MSTPNRIGNKWTINEVLSLQREFELLGWDIDQIAEKHGRTANAIMFKLDKEGFDDYNVLHSNYHKLIADRPVGNTLVLEAVDSEDEDNVIDKTDEDHQDEGEDPLSRRVDKLENGLDEIKNMLKALTTQKSLNGLGF